MNVCSLRTNDCDLFYKNACSTLRRDLLLPDSLLSAEASEVIARVRGGEASLGSSQLAAVHIGDDLIYSLVSVAAWLQL